MAKFITLTVYDYGRGATPVSINLDMVKMIRPHSDSGANQTVLYFADPGDGDFVVVNESYANVCRILVA